MFTCLIFTGPDINVQMISLWYVCTLSEVKNSSTKARGMQIASLSALNKCINIKMGNHHTMLEIYMYNR